MILKTLFLTLLFLPISAFSQEKVRVLLAESRQGLQLELPQGSRLSSGDQQWQLSQVKLSLVREQGQSRFQVQNFSQAFADVLNVQSHLIYWKGQRLDFPVQVHYQQGKWLLVGLMNMERYLQGVVPHEMPSSWPLEALKAQAVTARTYALWKMKTQKSELYDLRATVLDQVFRLPQKNEKLILRSTVLQALQETQGEVLLSANQSLLKTYYHSDCGGATDGARNVWGTDQSQSTVKDHSCGQRKTQWSSHWSLDKIQRQLQKEWVVPVQSSVKDIIVRSQLQSQRAEWVDVIFENGYLKRLRGEDLRRVLGYDKLRSTLFAIEKTHQGFAFKGRGFGHGVGMCQHGARALARAGENYKQILKHYYPSATLVAQDSPAESLERSRSVSSL